LLFQTTSSAGQAGRLHWTKSTPLPEARAGYAAGVLDGKLVIAGGTYWEGEKGNWTKKVFSARTHAFDPSTKTWEPLPDAPIPFGYAAFAVVENRLYVLGGYDGQAESRKILTLERRGPKYVWEIFGELPETRLFGKAVGHSSSIYLLGGVVKFEPTDAVGTCCTSKTATNQLQALDTANPDKGWRDLPPYPGGKRWLFSAASDTESLWMFGGIYSAHAEDPTTKFRQVLRFSFEQESWEKLQPLPQATLAAAPLVPLHVDGKILLMSFAKTVWQLDLKTQIYTTLSPLPEKAFVDHFVWLNGQIIGAGGENAIEGPRRRSEWTFVGGFETEE
jgi:N-acetylneuraminic acid mutarotase